MKFVSSVKLNPGDIRVSRLLLLFLPVFLALFSPAARTAGKDSLSASELFSFTNVYTAHFYFTPEQWDAMEPDQDVDFFAPPGNRPGAARGIRFGPGMFIAPAFLTAADTNRDSKLSKSEFESLAGRWFSAWDKNNSGTLTSDQLRDGFNAALGGGGVPRMSLKASDGKRNGLASMLGVEFEYVRADLEIAGQKFTNVAVRYKGNGTWMQSRGSLKRSLKVDLNKFVKGQKIAGISKLNFHNCVTDASWMNEVLSHRFYRDAGLAAPRTAYARVFVTVPGKHEHKYLGLYSLVENVDDNFTADQFRSKKGALFKPVTPDLFADLGDDWSNYEQTYDPKDDPAPADKQRIIDFARLVTHASDAEFAAKLPEFLDLDQFSRYMAATVWLATLDSILAIGQNYYLHLDPKSRKFQFIPWDLDHSFGQFFLMGTQEQRNELSIHKPWRGHNRFLERVYKVDAFKKSYLAHLKEINETIGRLARITKQVDEIAAAIRPVVEEESDEKLARFDKAVAGESIEPAGFGPGPGGPMMQGVQPIKKFAAARAPAVAAQLSGDSSGADLDAPAPGMPRNMGPGMFIGPAIHARFDSDKDGSLSRAEFTRGFQQWFASWDSENSGSLSEEALREALDREFAPPGGFPGPGGPGGGPARPPE